MERGNGKHIHMIGVISLKPVPDFSQLLYKYYFNQIANDLFDGNKSTPPHLQIQKTMLFSRTKGIIPCL